MSEIKWIKIVTDVFDDEKILLIETLPDADSIIVIWFKLLCLAGKQNNSGVFMLNDRMPYNEKMFATIFRRKESTVQLALRTFEEFGMIEIIEGAVTIPNWGRHQNIEAIESRREYKRLKQAEYRQRQKLITCGHPRGQNVDTQIREDKIREEKIREDKKSTPKAPKENSNGFAYEMVEMSSLSDSVKDKMKEWVTYKTEKKNVYQPTGFRNLLATVSKSIDEYGQDAVIYVIEYSMGNNYQGIVWNKLGEFQKGKAQKGYGTRFMDLEI